MIKFSATISLVSLALSLSVFAQNTATVAATTSTSTAQMCVERGLKCCLKARGKRAEKIRTKCEKKYKCTCPARLNTAEEKKIN